MIYMYIIIIYAYIQYTILYVYININKLHRPKIGEWRLQLCTGCHEYGMIPTCSQEIPTKLELHLIHFASGYVSNISLCKTRKSMSNLTVMSNTVMRIAGHSWGSHNFKDKLTRVVCFEWPSVEGTASIHSVEPKALKSCQFTSCMELHSSVISIEDWLLKPVAPLGSRLSQHSKYSQGACRTCVSFGS